MALDETNAAQAFRNRAPLPDAGKELNGSSGFSSEGDHILILVQCLTLLVLYPEHSTTRPSALQPQPNGVSREDAKAANQVDSELGVLGALARGNSVSSSNNKCVHLRGTTLAYEED
jgi:hypothetical protein